jgi:hypothetical protein
MEAKATNLCYILGPWMRSGQVQIYYIAAKKDAWMTETRPLTRPSPYRI